MAEFKEKGKRESRIDGGLEERWVGIMRRDEGTPLFREEKKKSKRTKKAKVAKVPRDADGQRPGDREWVVEECQGVRRRV